MGLIKLVKNRISSEWKKTFNDNVDYLNSAQEKTDEQINVTNKRIDNLVLHASGDNIAEVVDARVNAKGEVFDTLEGRLNNSEEEVENELDYLNTEVYNNGVSIDQLVEEVENIHASSYETLNIYVSTAGDDSAGDGSEDNPYLTIQTAVDQVPLVNSSEVFIWIADGVYLEDVIIRGVKSTRVVIRSVQDIEALEPEIGLPVKIRSIGFFYCAGYCQIRGVELVDQNNAPAFEDVRYGFCFEQSGYLGLDHVRCAEDTKSIDSYVATYTGGASKVHSYGSYYANQAQVNMSNLFGESRFSVTVTGADNTIGFEATNGTVRDGTTDSLSATTKHKIKEEGVIISEGIILDSATLKKREVKGIGG